MQYHAPALLLALLLAGCSSRPTVLGIPDRRDETPRECVPRSAAAPFIEVSDPALASALSFLERESPTFRRSVSRVGRTSSIAIVVGRSQDYPALERQLARAWLPDTPAGLFGAGVYTPPGTPLCVVHVIVFTEDAEASLRRRGASDAEIDVELALVLAHEIYGHALPLAELRVPRWPSPCRDPLPGDRDRLGCAVRRTNQIHRELGIAPRAEYQLLNAGPRCIATTGDRCRGSEPR